MSTTTKKLQLKFGTAFGTKTWTFSNVGSSITASGSKAQIKTLMQTMITNGSIYKYPPLALDSANVIETTTGEVDLS